MLEVGSLTDVITVSSPLEIIQTETGAREGVLRAEQIENLSVVSRSSLELLRIMPGVVAARDSTGFESVSFGGGANNTQGYTVNGMRSSNNTVSLDGSALIDIGSNSGVIVTLNNDMVQEVKVQSSNFAAEYGAGGMSVSAVTKAGVVAVPRHASTTTSAISKFAGERPLELDRRRRRSRRASISYPGGNIGGPIVLPGLQQGPEQGVLLRRLRGAAPAGRLGLALRRRADAQAARTATSRSSLTSNGQNLGQPVGTVNIPAGLPRRGHAGPEQQPARRTSRRSAACWPTCIRRRTTSIRTTASTTSTASSSRPTAPT